jgi:hypothetical protein
MVLGHELGWVVRVLMIILIAAVTEVSLIVDTVDRDGLLTVIDTAALHTGTLAIIFNFKFSLGHAQKLDSVAPENFINVLVLTTRSRKMLKVE